jgi:hypothetical protein
LFTQKEHLAAFQGEQAARLDQFGRPGNVRMLNSSLSDEMPNRS